ncbi:hypothetical protein NKR23_g329 [Pleurostoma richardsiae]|uniref:Uncharacterized protein n=1 Tax=Pleurostoma richardsiae TaxID=41990 RepID=A0AA38W0V1_9PEZI|nr:hypothetical protein NKR23_g329 [Pleurostoma richardsiae]
MATHHVVGDNMSPFLKRVLIPFWVIRILVMCLDIVVYALLIGVIASHSDDFEDDGGSVGGALGIVVVVMLIILLCLALDITCIVKRAKRTLSPRFFLIVNVVQTTIWTVLFILSMIGSRTAVAFIINIIVYLSFIGVLIYAGVIYHRQRKGTLRGTYVPAANPSEQHIYVQNTGYAYPPATDPYQGGAVYENTGYPSYTQPIYQGEQKPSYYDPQSQPLGAHELQSRSPAAHELQSRQVGAHELQSRSP